MVKMTIQYHDALEPYEHRFDKARTCFICSPSKLFDTTRQLKKHKATVHAY